MAVSNLYKLSVIVTPAGQIRQLEDRSIDPGVEELVLKGDGKISPQFFSVMEQRPMFRFSTTAIAATLTSLGVGFYTFSAAVDLYMAQLSASGGLSGAGAHKRITGTKGCLVPRRLRASHKAPAVIEYDGYFLSTDGVAAPISYAGAVSLPALTVADQAFTLGPASINGSALAAVESLEIDFGFGVLIEGGNGEVYPTFGGYEERAPVVIVRTKDPTLLAATGVMGLQQNATPSVFYLRKMDPAGGRIANATAQHVKFTITAAGFHRPGGIEEQDNRPTEAELISRPLDDGTNDILAISTASAIV